MFFHVMEPTVTDCDVNKSRTIKPSGSAALVCEGTPPVDLLEKTSDGGRDQPVSHIVKTRLLQRTKESEC